MAGDPEVEANAGGPPLGEGAGRPYARALEQLERMARTVASNDSQFDVMWAALQFARTATADGSDDGWTPLGPRNVGGAVRCLAQDPLLPSIFYAGSAEGGLWRTMDEGNTWEPLGEQDIGVVPVGAVAVAPGDRRVIYVGTGEPARYKAGGIGLFRSRDEGATFERLAGGNQWVWPAPTDGSAFRYTRLVVDPQAPLRCWAASSNGLWRFEGTTPHEEPLAYTNTDFNQKMVTDVAVIPDPADPGNKLWLLAAINGQGVRRGVFDRATGTTVWSNSTGLPPDQPNVTPVAANPFGRIRLAFAPSDANVAYALVEDRIDMAGVTYQTGYPLPLLRSADGGASFAYVDVQDPAFPADPTKRRVNRLEDPPAKAGAKEGQADYSMELVVHPTNPDVVVAGYVSLYRSDNRGGTWTTLINWVHYMDHDLRAQHGDMHALLFDVRERRVREPQRLWVGNDGGVSYTEDAGRNWRKRSYGIIGAQFIDISSHPVYPFIFGGGMQDNGTFISYGGPTWYRLGGGDGGAMVMDPGNPRAFFVTSQTRLYRTRIGTPGAGWWEDTFTPLREVPDRGLPASRDDMRVYAQQADTAVPAGFDQVFRGLVVGDPANANRLLLGRTNGAFLSTDGGATWPVQTPAFTARSGAPPQPDPKSSALALGPGTDLYVGTNSGDLFASPDHGASWNPAGSQRPFPDVVDGARTVQAWITAIAVHPSRPEVVAVAAFHPNRKVMLSHDKGVTWSDATGGAQLPPGGVSALAFHPTDERVLFAGTLVGVWVARELPAYNAGNPLPAQVSPGWKAFNRGLPPVLVNDLEVVAETLTLRAATYARGCFEANLRGVGAGGAPGAYATPEPYRVPAVRLSIRDHAMDDGRIYPAGHQLADDPDDPRLPPGRAAGLLAHVDGTQSVDIKVNAPDFVDRVRRFLLSERYGFLPDGSELDEEFICEPPIAGDTNRVYVQVHNRGYSPAANVQVALYYADAGDPAQAPALAGIAFPDAPAPGNTWQRCGVQTVGSVKPGQPVVVRFDWICPITIRKNLALLAICGCAQDALEAQPAGDAKAYAVARRQVALRVTPVKHDAVFVRDGLDDAGRRGSVSWGGRTPDILVLRKAEANAIPPGDLDSTSGPLGRLDDPRRGDRVRLGDDNAIFIRVHNRHDVTVHVGVKLFHGRWEHPSSGSWTRIDAAADAVPSRVENVGPGQWKVLRVDFVAADPAPDAPSATLPRGYILAALTNAVDAATGTELDPMPDISAATGHDEFWRFFNRGPLATNVAMRAVRFERGP